MRRFQQYNLPLFCQEASVSANSRINCHELFPYPFFVNQVHHPQQINFPSGQQVGFHNFQGILQASRGILFENVFHKPLEEGNRDGLQLVDVQDNRN